MTPWAQEWVDAFGSYTEFSPSGTGLRIVAGGANGFGSTSRHIDGVEPMSDQKAPAIEAANAGKFFAITGDWMVGTPKEIEDRPAVWKRLKAFLDGTGQPKARDRSGKPTGGGVPSLAPMSAKAIDEMQLPDVDFVVPGIVAVGGAMLGARPKEGKTYMMIDWGIAVASGGRALGSIPCEQGDALLLLLEDNAGRFKRRMRQMLDDAPKRAGGWVTAGDVGKETGQKADAARRMHARPHGGGRRLRRAQPRPIQSHARSGRAAGGRGCAVHGRAVLVD